MRDAILLTIFCLILFTISVFSLLQEVENLCSEYSLEAGDIVAWRVNPEIRGEVLRCLYSDKIEVNVGDKRVVWTLTNTIKE